MQEGKKDGASNKRPLQRPPPRGTQNSTRPDAPFGTRSKALLLRDTRAEAQVGGFSGSRLVTRQTVMQPVYGPRIMLVSSTVQGSHSSSKTSRRVYPNSERETSGNDFGRAGRRVRVLRRSTAYAFLPNEQRRAGLTGRNRIRCLREIGHRPIAVSSFVNELRCRWVDFVP
jgi:hypothetical protein